MSARFRHVYGAGPLHLVAVAASMAVAGYALSRVFDDVGRPWRVVTWLAGAIVAHDLVLFPVYALIGVAVSTLLLGRAARVSRLRIAALNHLRVPALLSGLLLLVWFPLVARKAPGTYARATTLSVDAYLGRWAAITAMLFGGSALVFALRAHRIGRQR
jgi:hypothetical protein